MGGNQSKKKKIPPTFTGRCECWTCHYVAVTVFCQNLFQHGAIIRGTCAFCPAGDCACQSEDLHGAGAEVRNRLPGDCHCPVSQQCGRVCLRKTANQWVEKVKETNVSQENQLKKHHCVIVCAGSLPGVSSLRLDQAGFFFLSLGWDRPTSPVQGYRLTYGPRGSVHTHRDTLILETKPPGCYCEWLSWWWREKPFRLLAFCFCGMMEVHFSLCCASMDHPAPDVSLVTWLLDMWMTCPVAGVCFPVFPAEEDRILWWHCRWCCYRTCQEMSSVGGPWFQHSAFWLYTLKVTPVWDLDPFNVFHLAWGFLMKSHQEALLSLSLVVASRNSFSIVVGFVRVDLGSPKCFMKGIRGTWLILCSISSVLFPI